jgi:DNA-binding XRE family transcriptional regulator
MKARSFAICAAICGVHQIMTWRVVSHEKTDEARLARASWVHALRTLLDLSFVEIETETRVDFKTAKRAIARIDGLLEDGDALTRQSFGAARDLVNEWRTVGDPEDLSTGSVEREIGHRKREQAAINGEQRILIAAGEKVREARRGLRVDRIRIASEMGISERNYRRIERGDVNMRITTLRSLCLELGISADEVLGIGDRV